MYLLCVLKVKPSFAVFASEELQGLILERVREVLLMRGFLLMMVVLHCVRGDTRISFLTLSRTELELRSTTLSLQILLEQIRKHFKIYSFCLESALSYRLLGKSISLSLFSVRLMLRFSELLSDRKYS